MDIPNPTRCSRPNKSTTPSERFLGAYPHAPYKDPNFTPAVTAAADDELNEDDIFWTNNYSAGPTHHSTPSSSSTSSTPRQHNHHHHKGFSHPESFGILAALPERDPTSSSSNPRAHHSHFYHKASVSSSSASPSPSQLIPAIPRPLIDNYNPPPLSSVQHHQSAPVNVPVLATAMRKHHSEFDAVDDEDNEVDDGGVEGEMLPPHEIVARNSVHEPMLACSVLEGVGRTLKGRDLRRVRNAVWRQTGFLD